MGIRAEFQTARLTLRPLALSDAPAIAEGLSDHQVTRWLTLVPFPYALDDAHFFLEGPGHGPGHWALDLGSGLIGVLTLKAELGYWLARRHHGQGLMTEAVAALLKAHFSSGGGTVKSGYHLGNAASAAVLHKAGFRDTVQVVKHQVSSGQPVTVQGMELTAEQGRARHGQD